MSRVAVKLIRNAFESGVTFFRTINLRRPITLRVTCAATVFMLLGINAHSAGTDDVTVVAQGLQFPEGVILVDGETYFVDYASSDVLRLDKRDSSRVDTIWHQDGCGPTGLAKVPDGLMVACYAGNTFVTVSLQGKILETLRQDAAGKPFDVPNDMALDYKDGVYFTASGSGPSTGRVYFRRGGGNIESVAGDLTNANGLVVSIDDRFLFVGETATDIIWKYPIAGDGRLGPRVRFIDLKSTLHESHPAPDGIRIDRRGNLFVALYKGSGLAIFSPDGALIQTVSLPRNHHTSLALSSDERFIFATALDDTVTGGYLGDLVLVPNPLSTAR